jgi:hypothetical protein
MEYLFHAEPQRRRDELELEPIHNTADTVLHHRRTEVDEEPQSAVKQPQIRQELFGIYTGNLFCGLQLHNYTVLDDELCPKTLISAALRLCVRRPG